MNLWLIPFCPLIGFLLNGLLGKRFPKQPISMLSAVGSVAGLFGFSLVFTFEVYPVDSPVTEHGFTWIQSGFAEDRFRSYS